MLLENRQIHNSFSRTNDSKCYSLTIVLLLLFLFGTGILFYHISELKHILSAVTNYGGLKTKLISVHPKTLVFPKPSGNISPSSKSHFLENRPLTPKWS